MVGHCYSLRIKKRRANGKVLFTSADDLSIELDLITIRRDVINIVYFEKKS